MIDLDFFANITDVLLAGSDTARQLCRCARKNHSLQRGWACFLADDQVGNTATRLVCRIAEGVQEKVCGQFLQVRILNPVLNPDNSKASLLFDSAPRCEYDCGHLYGSLHCLFLGGQRLVVSPSLESSRCDNTNLILLSEQPSNLF